MVETVEERERVFMEYRVAVSGLFGRNRKAKTTSEAVARHDAYQAEEVVRVAVKAKLEEMKARPGASYRVTVGPRTEKVTRYSDGTSARVITFRLFADQVLFEGVVGAAG